MNTDLLNQKRRYGLLYGLLGGFSFSFMAWGIDAIALSSAQAGYPWSKVLIGLLASLSIGGLVGWLGVRLASAIWSVVFWIVAAFLFSELAIWLPFKVVPFVATRLDPSLTPWLVYPEVANSGILLGFSFLCLAIAGFIVGALENTLVDQVAFSSAPGAIILSSAICILSLGIAGSAVDSLVNDQLRHPLVTVNNMLQFAIANEYKNVDPSLARENHLSTTASIDDLLARPRRLFVKTFDGTETQVDVLVDFDGNMVDCVTVVAQPIFCKKLDNP